jgi:hypothetical protein
METIQALLKEGERICQKGDLLFAILKRNWDTSYPFITVAMS